MGWGSSKKYALDPPPDVKVHLTEKVGGCHCGCTDAHTHTQEEHRAAVDRADPWGDRRR